MISSWRLYAFVLCQKILRSSGVEVLDYGTRRELENAWAKAVRENKLIKYVAPFARNALNSRLESRENGC